MSYRIFTLSIIASLFLNQAFAEGTKQTTETSSDYTHLLTNFGEYYDFGRYNGTVNHRLFIRIEDR